MIIDTHQHVFWHHRDDAGLIADMDEHGIDVAWLLTWEIPPDEDSQRYLASLNPIHANPSGSHNGIPLSDLLKTRRRYPDRFVVGYCPCPYLGDASALFRSAYHMHHVRICGEWKFRMLFDDPRCLELFHTAGELGCPVVLHLDVPYLPSPDGLRPVYQPYWYGGTVANLERALQACPQTHFIGHAPGFWREISGDADKATQMYPEESVKHGGRLDALFNRHPNLYADLSAGSGRKALSRDPDHARQFLLRHADRLLFGRDYYGQALHQFLLSLDLPPEVTRAIYTDNACRLLGDQI